VIFVTFISSVSDSSPESRRRHPLQGRTFGLAGVRVGTEGHGCCVAFRIIWEVRAVELVQQTGQRGHVSFLRKGDVNLAV
jgi:hypothetical protein